MYVDDKKLGEQQVVTEPWRQVLLDTADVIEKRGHCKHMLFDPYGRVCVNGAFGAVSAKSGKMRWSGDARIAADKLHAYLKLPSLVAITVGSTPVTLAPWADLSHWNNARERTKQQVIDALVACARS